MDNKTFLDTSAGAKHFASKTVNMADKKAYRESISKASA